MKLDEDGRVYITDLVAGGIHVLSPDGVAEAFIPVGVAPTNCLFTAGALIVTDAGKLADDAEAAFNGTLWHVPLQHAGQPVARGVIDMAARA